MDIVTAIRKLCEGKNAFHDLFDKTKTYDKLLALADDKKDAELFGALLYGKARNTLLEMINDAYNFKQYAVEAHGLLMSDGLSAMDAKRALEIFFIAFGFPGYRTMGAQETIVDESGNSKTVYEGEVKNGKPHGCGSRNFYYEGKWSALDECVWIDGIMMGYAYAKAKASATTVLTVDYVKSSGNTVEAPLYAYWAYGNGRVSSFTSSFTGEWAASWENESGNRFFQNVLVSNTPAERVDYPYSIGVTYDGSYSQVEIIPVVLNPYATTDVTVTLPDGTSVT